MNARKPATGAYKSNWRYAAVPGIVLVAAGLAEILFRTTHTSRLGSVFLIATLFTSYWLGSGPGYLAAAMGFVIYNIYLVGPRFDLALGATESFIALGSFLAVATLMGSLTGRVRDEAERAKTRASTTQALLDATRDFAASPDEDFIRERLAHHLAAAAKGAAVVREGHSLFTSPLELARLDEPLPLDLASHTVDGEPSVATTYVDQWTLRPLFADGSALGLAAWRPEPGAQLAAEQQTLLEILADAGAAAIARVRLAAAKANAESRVRTEELRNALLSSISHDLRTPLAAIMASASSLEEFGDSFDAATRRDLTATIQEEAERLNAFVANFLNMTKIESGAIVVQRTPFSLREVVDRTIRRQELVHKREVVAVQPRAAFEASGDPVLFEQALSNVVENAIRYSPPGAPVQIACSREEGRAVVRVTDSGGGVPPRELARIFDKFYRSSGVTSAGTGLGLSITRGFMEAMGGEVTAENRTGPGGGLAVTLKLAVAE